MCETLCTNNVLLDNIPILATQSFLHCRLTAFSHWISPRAHLTNWSLHSLLMVFSLTWTHSQAPTQSSWWITAAFTSPNWFKKWYVIGKFAYNIHLSYLLFSNYTRGVWCEFLLPYSPDYNPIELAFSAVKYHLHHHHHEFLSCLGSNDSTNVYLALIAAVYTITPQDAFGWYKYCNYIWTMLCTSITMQLECAN